ncbi:lytic transglycosylase domain-containing protein [Desulforegula conservatrix]|uniref:lytic transglycosylase domain-containing protein n=1 Tax=Desulforegula conservatrix TaxID=153026 RepID=UPI0003F56380|nr:lytic transglycosylase domain-containing protein [Desulforegula conservatrix]
MNLKLRFFASIFFILFSISAAFAEDSAPIAPDATYQSQIQQKNSNDHYDLVSAVRIKPPVTFCGENVPVENADVKERLETELLLMAWDKAQTVLWMKRAGRYFPHIEKQLKEKGLPDDIKYIAIIESSLRSGVNSSAGASGFWQFIESTGAKYGLDVNPVLDERRNLVLSTNAALQYFSSLHSLFGTWSLAAAAYNMGEYGLKERIESQETRDYYNLYLPNETMRYVFRAIAVKMIFSEPAKYGFNLNGDDVYKPVEADQVTVSCPYRISIMLISKAAQTYYKTIRDLNPEIKGSFLEKGEYKLSIPKGSLSGFISRFEANLRDNNLLHFYGIRKTHVIKEGESISILSERFGVKPETLKKWNGLDSESEMVAGKKIIYYSRM